MGPLEGVKVIELAGIGPTPFAGMMLSDLGAEVTRVDRVGGNSNPVASGSGPMERGKRSIAVNLKDPDGIETILDLVAQSDVLLEGFRAGVTDRLGVGPDVCLAVNENLVYGRMTGWGQSGPMADRAGHDINYISLASPLAHIGRPGQAPTVPLNLVGDFGGGSVFVVLGIVSALLSAARGGKGQVVDAAMVDGASYLMSPLFAAHASGFWSDERGTNLLDSGAPFYDVYATSDGRYMAVGAIEPQFYAELVDGLGLGDRLDLASQNDQAGWDVTRELLSESFSSQTMDHWTTVFEGRDACVSPVLTMGETPQHAQAIERGAYFETCGVTQPSPAPRFSVTAADPATDSGQPGQHTAEVLEKLGYSADKIADLSARGVISTT
jgi:alpha-methylacyl-CoA racemase